MDPLRLSDKASFSPESVALAKHAFEQTWAEIAPRFSPGRHAEVRNVLASAVMAAARIDSDDAAALRKAGLQVMERRYPVEMHMSLADERWTRPRRISDAL